MRDVVRVPPAHIIGSRRENKLFGGRAVGVFDIYIEKMARYVEEMRAKGRRIRVFDPSGSDMQPR